MSRWTLEVVNKDTLEIEEVLEFWTHARAVEAALRWMDDGWATTVYDNEYFVREKA